MKTLALFSAPTGRIVLGMALCTAATLLPEHAMATDAEHEVAAAALVPSDAEAEGATATAEASPESSPAPAAPAPLLPIPKSRWVLSDLTIFRWNPIGLETQFRTGYQRKFYDANDKLALRDNFWHVGTFIRLNPASARAAAVLEIQPLSLLNLRWTAEYLHFYGNFTFVQSRQHAGLAQGDAGADPVTAEPSLADSAMKDNKEGKWGNYSTGGFHATFEPLLQAKVGKVAIRSRGLFGYFDMNLRRNDRVWYEATLDTSLPGKGWVIANDLDVLYMTDFGLNIGLRHSSVFPQLSKAQNPDDVDNSHQRLGVLAAYTFRDDGYSKFNKPTLIAITSWYLNHRFRTGQDVSRAMPYFVLGFAFTSDLLDVK